MNYHVPVMLREVIDFLDPKPGAVYVDATLGTGGHTEIILKRGGRVIGIDVDQEVLNIAKERLARFGERITYIHTNFSKLNQVLDGLKLETVKGIIYDLGTNLVQLENPERGFSLYRDGPLDMRMDRSLPITCQDLVNNLPEDRLREIIRNYGEERWAKRIARKIVKERKSKPIETTLQLAHIVEETVFWKGCHKKKGDIHLATKTFQALRIVVNDELDSLKDSLKGVITYLEPGGRIIVLSFHSLEDRIAKHTFLEWAKSDPPLVKILTKKPLVPTEVEIKGNPRARSAKLRVAERIPLREK
ncbi:TPA: 16S rRNA (cytosine(1402)-N(4))-methyltransferase [bacterium]|nr:16S rRNA (cytosine(1402)-N(4))-methyltransferase [bacterium]